MARYIDILKAGGAELLDCQSPARYLGGEYGRLANPNAPFQTVVAFPDLYEIGMSNNALKILYNRLNELTGVSCDRVFAPAPDFEQLLAAKNIPLYALDTGLVVQDAALLLITISYELCATGLLSILAAAHIPLRREERDERSPIVIAGGPCVSNPLPFAPFIDAFWIGEAEDGFFELVAGLAQAQERDGADRAALLQMIASHPSVWTEDKTRVFRAVDENFARRPARHALFPIPNGRIVQQHAAIEIMRGCPNGCRFCHAGVWYRPCRQKPARVIMEEVDASIRRGGFREISLSSLSSGDYHGIDGLVDALNARYGREHVSFQLPSLHVSTLSLGLLDKVAQVRKSGLTFAVETPSDARQLAINKQVTLDMVCELLALAKKSGYKTAKFYFMIGLPIFDGEQGEADEIIAFIEEAARRTRMHFSVSAGVFIPKPHTPFQRAAQLDEEAARESLEKIRKALKAKGHKVKTHDPFISTLEGVIARGGRQAAGIIEEAFHSGCRLDAWSEHCNQSVWREILSRHAGYVSQTLGARGDEALPWDGIESGVSGERLKAEWNRAARRELSAPCAPHCAECKTPCGIQKRLNKTEQGVWTLEGRGEEGVNPPAPPLSSAPLKAPSYLLLFQYRKEGKAAYLAHLALIEIFSSALLRAGVPVSWTEGFNPLPRLDFAAPLAVGVSSCGEIALAGVEKPVDGEEFRQEINAQLPEGLCVTAAETFTVPFGEKKHAASALLWGFAYQNGGARDLVEKNGDKPYRAAQRHGGLLRREVFAKDGDSGHASYFEVFRRLYPH